MIATAGLPTQALGSTSGSQPHTATDAVTRSAPLVPSAGLLTDVRGRARSAALSAPLTATVTFETSQFRADPVVVRPAAHPVAAHPVTSQPVVSHPVVSRPAAQPVAYRPAGASANRPVAVAGKVGSSRAGEAPTKAEATTKPARTRSVAEKHHSAPAPAKHRGPATPAKRPKVAKPAKSVPSGSVRGSSVLATAARYIGTPYLYGGMTPRGFDCSGFTGYVYRQLGISLPRTANQQMLATRRVSRSAARPGDLVFFVSGGRAYHVGLYAGGGKLYDAPRTGKTVSKRAIWDAAVVFGRVTR
jgi:cell wall-associated NlpC family hydrolase